MKKKIIYTEGWEWGFFGQDDWIELDPKGVWNFGQAFAKYLNKYNHHDIKILYFKDEEAAEYLYRTTPSR